MDNKEIIEAISVLSETLKILNPEAMPVLRGNVPSETYITVCEKIQQLTICFISLWFRFFVINRKKSIFVSNKLCRIETDQFGNGKLSKEVP